MAHEALELASTAHPCTPSAQTLSYGGLDRPWVPDVVGRAWGNRGNARARQGKLQEALADYNTSIALCPWSVDPVLNRGVALEAMGRFEGEEAGPSRLKAWQSLPTRTCDPQAEGKLPLTSLPGTRVAFPASPQTRVLTTAQCWLQRRTTPLPGTTWATRSVVSSKRASLGATWVGLHASIVQQLASPADRCRGCFGRMTRDSRGSI